MHVGTVDVLVEIQQMDFQQGACPAHRRARADIGRTGHRLALETEYLNGEDSPDWRHLAMQINIRRRETKGTPELVTVRHAPTHAIRSSQQFLRHREITGSQNGA